MVKMATFEEVFDKACAEKEIPGAVSVATDKTGRILSPIILYAAGTEN